MTLEPAWTHFALLYFDRIRKEERRVPSMWARGYDEHVIHTSTITESNWKASGGVQALPWFRRDLPSADVDLEVETVERTYVHTPPAGTPVLVSTAASSSSTPSMLSSSA